MEEFASSTGGTESRLRSVGTGIGLAVGGFLAAIVVVVLGISLLGAFGIDIQQQPVALLALAIVLQGLGFGVAVLAYMALTDNWSLVRLRWPTLRDLGWAVLGLVGVFVGYFLILLVISALDVSTAQNSIVEQGRQNPGLVPLLIPLAILVVGPSEELLFRGAIQGVLRRSYSPVPAVVIASALFGVAHVFALSGSGTGVLVYIAVTFTLGLILGAVYERSGNIVVPSLVHGVYNAILFAALYVQVSGGL